MGNCIKPHPHAQAKKSQLTPQPLNAKTQNFKITQADLVKEKTNNINEDYTFLETLGKGAYGEVKKAVHKSTGIIRAIKVINKSKQDAETYETMLNEIKVLKTLDHPHIMKIVEFYQDKTALYIVNEYYDGGELFDKLTASSSFSEAQAAQIMKQILSVVNYCHKNKIMHRDLKPENLVYESKKEDAALRVIDFGTSQAFKPGELLHKPLGTCYYVAPEVLKKRYTEKCDLWSCGVILYFILSGHPPFAAKTEKKVLEKVITGLFEFKVDEWEGVSDEGKDLIRKLLEYQPEKRLSAEEALNHPWFNKILGESQIGNKPLAVKTLKNLQEFRAGRKLQESMWIFMVTYFSSKEEKTKLLETFQALDKDKNGSLTPQEIKEGFKLIMGRAQNDEEVDELIAKIDHNNSGVIDYSEFVTATINKMNLLSKQRLEAAFKLFDSDGNGYITVDELKELLNPEQTKPKKSINAEGQLVVVGESPEQDVWTELINEVDSDADGKISLKEFKDMMLKAIN